MLPETYVRIARRKDQESNIIPWSFATTNPGYIWLTTQSAAVLDGDLKRDTTVVSTSVSAGSVSSSKSYRASDRVISRSDAIEQAIAAYETGNISSPRRTRGTFGPYHP